MVDILKLCFKYFSIQRMKVYRSMITINNLFIIRTIVHHSQYFIIVNLVIQLILEDYLYLKKGYTMIIKKIINTLLVAIDRLSLKYENKLRREKALSKIKKAKIK